jgi:hypothetical protein
MEYKGGLLAVNAESMPATVTSDFAGELIWSRCTWKMLWPTVNCIVG